MFTNQIKIKLNKIKTAINKANMLNGQKSGEKAKGYFMKKRNRDGVDSPGKIENIVGEEIRFIATIILPEKAAIIFFPNPLVIWRKHKTWGDKKLSREKYLKMINRVVIVQISEIEFYYFFFFF